MRAFYKKPKVIMCGDFQCAVMEHRKSAAFHVFGYVYNKDNDDIRYSLECLQGYKLKDIKVVKDHDSDGMHRVAYKHGDEYVIEFMGEDKDDLRLLWDINMEYGNTLKTVYPFSSPSFYYYDGYWTVKQEWSNSIVGIGLVEEVEVAIKKWNALVESMAASSVLSISANAFRAGCRVPSQ